MSNRYRRMDPWKIIVEDEEGPIYAHDMRDLPSEEAALRENAALWRLRRKRQSGKAPTEPLERAYRAGKLNPPDLPPGDAWMSAKRRYEAAQTLRNLHGQTLPKGSDSTQRERINGVGGVGLLPIERGIAARESIQRIKQEMCKVRKWGRDDREFRAVEAFAVDGYSMSDAFDIAEINPWRSGVAKRMGRILDKLDAAIAS